MNLRGLVFCGFLGLCACDGGDDRNGSLGSKKNLSLTEADFEKSNFCKEAIEDPGEDVLSRPNIDKERLANELTGAGITGYIHGVVPAFKYVVMNYGETLSSVQFNLFSYDEDMLDSLMSLKRHDQVRIKGKLIPSRSPVDHIQVEGIEIVKAYDKPVEQIDYSVYKKRLESLSESLPAELFGKVHSVLADGQALVLDYEDMVLPIFVDRKDQKDAAKLYRNDKIRIKVKTLPKARGPLHLTTDSKDGSAITVVDHMVNCHAKYESISGLLTKFNKSPQINRDVFAVKMIDPNGIERNFTIFPDIDPRDDVEGFMTLFDAVSNKLSAVWEDHIATVSNGRNSRYNKKLRVKVNGKMNVVSKNQANPQIYIKSVDDVEVY